MTENNSTYPDSYAPVGSAANPLHPLPPKAPKPPKKSVVLLSVAGLFFGGMMIGGAAFSTTTTVEKVVEKPVEKIVNVTPNSCLIALDQMEAGFNVAAEVMGYMQETIQAISTRDVAAMEAIAPKIDAATARLNKISPVANAAKAECRAAK